MSLQFEVVRSVNDKRLHLIYGAGTFDTLPHRILSLGPWQGLSGGVIDTLKPHYRLQLAEQNFVVVYQGIALFRPTR